MTEKRKRARKAGEGKPESVRRITEDKPIGRPTKLTPELADEICDRIAGGETLPNICLDDHIPAERTIRRWAREGEGFRQMYARAREEQMHAWADEIITISDDGSRDYKVDGEGGNARLVPDHDHIQRSRLRVDTRKFLMAKIAPKTFGEKVEVTHSGAIGRAGELTDEELARIAAGGSGGTADAPTRANEPDRVH